MLPLLQYYLSCLYLAYQSEQWLAAEMAMLLELVALLLVLLSCPRALCLSDVRVQFISCSDVLTRIYVDFVGLLTGISLRQSSRVLLDPVAHRVAK